MADIDRVHRLIRELGVQYTSMRMRTRVLEIRQKVHHEMPKHPLRRPAFYDGYRDEVVYECLIPEPFTGIEPIIAGPGFC